MTIRELVNKLRRPIYVLTMNQRNTAPGSDKRCRNATKEIDALVMKYCKERQYRDRVLKD